MRSGTFKSRALHRMNRHKITQPDARAKNSRQARFRSQEELIWDARTDFFFITLCTQHCKNIFGQVQEQTLVLNPVGQRLQDCWYELPVLFPRIFLDLFIIMSNHLHGLLVLPRRTAADEPERDVTALLTEFIRVSAQALAEVAELQASSIWRPGFQQTRVQSEAELNLLRDYIVDNPAHWDADPLNPQPKSHILLHPPLGEPPQN